MTELDPIVTAASAAHHEGRFEEAIPLLVQLFERSEQESASMHSAFFMTMFTWQLMLEDYPPARAALQALRDDQIRKFLAGQLIFAPDDTPVLVDEPWRQKPRFSVIVRINDLLHEPASTCALFAELDANNPDLARRYGYMALPAIVAEQQWALAERYRRDPLQVLPECNRIRHDFGLFPPLDQAPRLAATLMGLMGDVHLALAVLENTGRAGEATALRAAVLAGLEDDKMRGLAARDLAAPGTISRELADHRMALEAAAPPSP